MGSDSDKIAAVLIAAGASKRMGHPKQLLPWGNTFLLAHAIHQFKQSGIATLFVVLGAYEKRIRSAISVEENIRLISHPEWEKGMGSSIAKGVETALKTENYNALLIALGDQPLIDTSHYFQLVTKHKNHPEAIIATQMDHKYGVPALFPEKHFTELQQLQEDYGARFLLQQYQNNIIPLPSEGKTIDLDTPETYREWHQNIFKKAPLLQ